MRARVILVVMTLWSFGACAAEIVDATGRTVQLPDHVMLIAPAGPPAAVLLAAIAPDLMAGWPSPLSDEARAFLSPNAANLPAIPRVTGHEDVSAEIMALKPDLILDYGAVSPRYADLARATHQRSGIPTILLDGSLGKIPDTFRMLGAALHREGRAEVLARFAEALLMLPITGVRPRVLYARGADGLTIAAPDTDVTEVFTRLGWRAVAPEGRGSFRAGSIDVIRALDPDILVFSDPGMRQAVKQSDAWKTVRAVREGHAIASPNLPFGWIEEPPSINRLVGLAWLEGRDPVLLAALSNAVIYGHTLSPAELVAVLAGASPVQP